MKRSRIFVYVMCKCQYKNTQKPKKILVDTLSSMNKKERKLVSKIYEIIKKNLENEVAEELINKIQEELKNG